MNTEELKQYFSDNYPGITFPEITSKFLNIECSREGLHEFAKKLKGDEKLHFDYLFCQTAVDWPEF